MSASLFSELSWLPPVPENFRVQCRDLAQGDEELGWRLRSLSTLRLDENKLVRLAKVITRARSEERSMRPLDTVRLGLLSNSTTDFIVPAITASAPRHGLDVEVQSGHFGQYMQEALSPQSALYAREPDVVLVAIDYRGYFFQTCPGDVQQADDIIDRCMAQVSAIRAAIHEHSGAVCIFQTLAAPAESLFGSLDRALPGTMQNLIKRFNQRLSEMVLELGDLLLDVAGLAQIVGLAHWHSPMSWNVAKLPFSHEFLPLYADHVGRILGAVRGKSRRCLVLDLDNTVWGGVIGDDGVEGIHVAQGDAIGEAFLDVQRLALAYRQRGVVLAVSSKNTDEIARQPFLQHPEMLLRLDHIAIFQANWEDKVTNITAIAEALSLGLDSFVLLDDNPVERDLVRQMLPMVAVPELPADPALYARTLTAAGYFEATRLSSEDLARAEFYQENSRRITLRQQRGDLGSYLLSLNMEITFQPFDAMGRSRIAQLMSKSNQFNLTTHRYTEEDVAAMQANPNYFTLQVRLSDLFGDNGMVSVVICRGLNKDLLEIDTWLMSCRVLGRSVEQAVLQELVTYGRGHGFSRLIGRYIPTEKNALVANHYQTLGFKHTDTLSDGSSVWELDLLTAADHVVPMIIRHIEATP